MYFPGTQILAIPLSPLDLRGRKKVSPKLANIGASAL
jgi:hypothetical protein